MLLLTVVMRHGYKEQMNEYKAKTIFVLRKVSKNCKIYGNFSIKNVLLGRV